MDSKQVKSLTKQVKLKIDSFLSDVDLKKGIKLTQCREILAIAHGLKNSHQLKNLKKKNSLNEIGKSNPLYLTMAVMPNINGEYYSEKIRGVKLYLNDSEVSEILSYKTFIEEKDILIQKELGVFTGFGDFNIDGFESEEDLEINELALVESGIIMNDFQFYDNDNVYEIDNEDKPLSYSLNITKLGIEVEVSLVDKDTQVFYSSHTLSWESILKANEINKNMKPKTVVYLQLEEDPVEKRESNRVYSIAIMYLGYFSEDHIKRCEDLNAFSKNLWENDIYIGAIKHEVQDRSIYSNDKKECYKSALEICEKSDYFIVNKSELEHLK